MQTREIVSWIHRRNPKYSPTEILEILNQVHQRCVEQEWDQFLYRDPSTGMPPFLTTVSGQFAYDCPVNCRKTSKLAILIMNHDPRPFHHYPISNQPFAEHYQFNWAGRKFLELPYVYQYDANPEAGVLGKVYFGGKYDPGNTTNKYYHFFWVKANPILTLDDELQISDSNVHYMIMEAISAQISSEDYGASAENFAIIKKLIVDVGKSLNSGADGRRGLSLTARHLRDF